MSFVEDGKLCSISLLDEINIEGDDGVVIGKGFKIHSPGKNNWTLQAHDIAKQIISKFDIKRTAFMVSFRSDFKNNLRLL